MKKFNGEVNNKKEMPKAKIFKKGQLVTFTEEAYSKSGLDIDRRVSVLKITRFYYKTQKRGKDNKISGYVPLCNMRVLSIGKPPNDYDVYNTYWIKRISRDRARMEML